MQFLQPSNFDKSIILDDGWILDLILAHNTTWSAAFKGGKVQHIQARSALLARQNGRHPLLLLHRVVMNYFGNEFCVDHINGCVLDNRRCNLRLCTRQQNAFNRRKSAGYSRYKNVVFDYKANSWGICITVGGVKHSPTARFESELEAAKEADILLLSLHGDFARLNFPTGNGRSDQTLSN